MKHFHLLALQGLLAATFHLPTIAADNPLSLLPTSGQIEARIMQIGMPDEAQRTAGKIQAAFANQPEWANAFIASSTPGRPLPYHPNMRITASEYESFLAAAHHLSLVQVGTLKLSTVKDKNGVRITTQPTTSKLNGLVLSKDERSVSTPLATLSEMNQINNTSKESATGRWTGIQWRYEATSDAGVLAVKLAMGKRTDYGDCIIYYDVKDSRSGTAEAYYEVLLFPANK